MMCLCSPLRFFARTQASGTFSGSGLSNTKTQTFEKERRLQRPRLQDGRRAETSRTRAGRDRSLLSGSQSNPALTRRLSQGQPLLAHDAFHTDSGLGTSRFEQVWKRTAAESTTRSNTKLCASAAERNGPKGQAEGGHEKQGTECFRSKLTLSCVNSCDVLCF
jgi:hypothetical protein